MDIAFTKNDILRRGVAEIIEEKSLAKRLASGKKLRVKFGIDPTGPNLHLGHTVPLWKLRQFQEEGHTAVIVIGDYTASIGDPSGKNKTRPPLSADEIENNYAQYEEQMLKIVLQEPLEVHKQSEWYEKFSLKDVIALVAGTSVGHLLSHETFRERIKKGEPFATHELLYPFLQGYDSIAVNADVELGATEQKFNLLMGRELQRGAGMEPQEVVMSPYLLGTDGKEKMSKSAGNYIGLLEDPDDIFGKVMSIADEEIHQYFELATPLPTVELAKLKVERATGEQARDLKLLLAKLITSLYSTETLADTAQERFLSIFQKGEAPQDSVTVTVSPLVMPITDLLVETELAPSKSEARRLVEQGAVRVNEEKIVRTDEEIDLHSPVLVQVGKRRSVRVKGRS